VLLACSLRPSLRLLLSAAVPRFKPSPRIVVQGIGSTGELASSMLSSLYLNLSVPILYLVMSIGISKTIVTSASMVCTLTVQTKTSIRPMWLVSPISSTLPHFSRKVHQVAILSRVASEIVGSSALSPLSQPYRISWTVSVSSATN